PQVQPCQAGRPHRQLPGGHCRGADAPQRDPAAAAQRRRRRLQRGDLQDQRRDLGREQPDPWRAGQGGRKGGDGGGRPLLPGRGGRRVAQHVQSWAPMHGQCWEAAGAEQGLRCCHALPFLPGAENDLLHPLQAPVEAGWDFDPVWQQGGRLVHQKGWEDGRHILK
ncbi:unnamed protein product, partial [Heterosigma akashiwo]